MKLAFFPFATLLAVACSAQSGDPAATGSQALSVGHYYTCAPSGACGTDAGTGEAACATIDGCTWSINDCVPTTPCATGDLDTAEECTSNPVCKATEHLILPRSRRQRDYAASCSRKNLLNSNSIGLTYSFEECLRTVL